MTGRTDWRLDEQDLPEGMSALMTRAKPVLERRSAALFRGSDGPMKQIGTGVLLEIGDQVVLATAAHVADRALLPPDGRTLCVGLPGTPTRPLIIPHPIRAMRSRLPDGVKLDDDPHDLAVVLIADEQASVLRRHYSLTKLQEILPVEFRPVAGHWYGTYGFPGEKSESYSIDGEMFTRYEDAFAGSEPVQRVPPEIASRSGLAQLVVKYRRKASFGRGLERRRAPDPHGMSGGGMWLLTRNIGLAKWWDESQVRLAAIMIEYHEALGCLVGTPAIEVVRFVYTFEPSLQSVIDATFPFIKSMPAGYRGATIPPNFPRPGSRRA